MIGSHARISSIFVITNSARFLSSFGSIGGFLVRKLVKPTKLFCSWTPYDSAFSQLLTSQTKPHIGTAATWVLWEADATVWQEVGRFDPMHGVFNQLAELATLFVRDRGAEVLHFDHPLADKHDLRHIRDAGHPRIADQLRI